MTAYECQVETNLVLNLIVKSLRLVDINQVMELTLPTVRHRARSDKSELLQMQAVSLNRCRVIFLGSLNSTP